LNLGIVMTMPSEAFLREWERGITRTISSVPIGPIRDPAFMEREPNPVVRIRTEDGEAIYIESPEGRSPRG